jgi:hypothetical protein
VEADPDDGLALPAFFEKVSKRRVAFPERFFLWCGRNGAEGRGKLLLLFSGVVAAGVLLCDAARAVGVCLTYRCDG